LPTSSARKVKQSVVSVSPSVCFHFILWTGSYFMNPLTSELLNWPLIFCACGSWPYIARLGLKVKIIRKGRRSMSIAYGRDNAVTRSVRPRSSFEDSFSSLWWWTCRYEWLAELERRGGMEKCVATLPDVNMKRIKQFARMKRLMTKDDVERHLSGHALTTKQQQLEALKERYEHAGQLDSTSEPKMASIDCHKVLDRVIFLTYYNSVCQMPKAIDIYTKDGCKIVWTYVSQ